MKHIMTFTFLMALLTTGAMANSKSNVMAKGEVETDCPWAKQDERNGDISSRLKAVTSLKDKKKKTRME